MEDVKYHVTYFAQPTSQVHLHQLIEHLDYYPEAVQWSEEQHPQSHCGMWLKVYLSLVMGRQAPPLTLLSQFPNCIYNSWLDIWIAVLEQLDDLRNSTPDWIVEYG